MMKEMVPTGPTGRGTGAGARARSEEGQKKRRQKNQNLPAASEEGKRRQQTRQDQQRRRSPPPPPPPSQSPPPPQSPSTSSKNACAAENGAAERESLGGDGDDLGAGRASYGDDLDTLERRRSEELKLIGEYDSATINPRRECWFIVDTKWLQCWAKFVRGEGPPPGRISNEALVEDDLKTPVEGLVSRVDYRGVNPTVWFLYLEMYGKDSAQDLCRYVIDLYEAEVPPKYRKEIYEEPMRRAQVEVQKMRWRVEPDEVRLPDKPRLCCCITEGVIDCVFMALFTCGAKRRRRCPRWLCCCSRRTNASGGRYSRVINRGEADDGDDDSEIDEGEFDFGAREEEDLHRLRSGRGGGGGRGAPPPPRRNGGATAGR